ncbi:hypothetical protein M0R45_000704 [Rubus argutus]|uniref:Uncharacterized protein n=1 Tax=Rubus argutus TaxID=59490 RepID=A0AAW1VK63_RUBAR
MDLNQANTRQEHGPMFAPMYFFTCHGHSRLATPTQVHTAATASPFVTDYVIMLMFIVAFFVYFGSLTVKLLAHAPNAEMGEFINNIIFLLRTLASILLLLILVRAFGLFAQYAGEPNLSR